MITTKSMSRRSRSALAAFGPCRALPYLEGPLGLILEYTLKPCQGSPCTISRRFSKLRGSGSVRGPSKTGRPAPAWVPWQGRWAPTTWALSFFFGFGPATYLPFICKGNTRVIEGFQIRVPYTQSPWFGNWTSSGTYKSLTLGLDCGCPVLASLNRSRWHTGTATSVP